MFNNIYKKRKSAGNENDMHISLPFKVGYSMNLIREKIHH